MDRRTKRTLSALLQALTDLLSHRPWDKINVQNICNEGDVARSTFYSHFDNKQQLLDVAFEHLAAELRCKCRGRGLATYGTFEFMPALLDHIHSNQHIFHINSQLAGSSQIFARFKQVIDRLVDEEFGQLACPPQSTKPGNNNRATFIKGGIHALLEQWSRDACQPSPEEMTQRIDRFVGQLL